MTTTDKLKQLGSGFIDSKLAFGVTFWANAPDYLINRVDVFLNKVVVEDFYPAWINPKQNSEKVLHGAGMDDILPLRHSLSHINHVPANSILSLQGSRGQLHMRQIRMKQVTSPTRRDAYFSRICRLFNQLHAYNLPPMEKNFIMRIRRDPDAYRSELRNRLYWRMNDRP